MNNSIAGDNSIIQAIDLFCGAGGLTRGLLNAGVSVKAGVDLEESCRFPYENNNEGVAFICQSVADVDTNALRDCLSDNTTLLLCGCAPCQAFSTLNQKNEDKRTKTGRWILLDEFARLIAELSPELVSMENVPGLMRQDVFFRFLESLHTGEYHCDYRIVDCSDYGMPQKRRRLVLVASRLGKISIPEPSDQLNKETVKSAIGHLPSINAGETDRHDTLHSASALSKQNLARIIASRPGGTWREWSNDLQLPCHKEKSGDGYGAVYGRMEWNKPSPTITTQFYNYGSGRFGHPEQNRALSLREGALLQGFPEQYKFFDCDHPLGKRVVGALIGNAVPVGLGELIGKTLIEHVMQLKSAAARTSPQRGEAQF